MLPSKAFLSVHKSLLISVILFSSVLGNPLTKRQFAEIRNRLEKAAEEQLNSEDMTKSADILIQEKYEEKNLTYYRGDDKSLPVFISWGLNNIAKKVHVLLRGEDYLSPQDEHTFIVLRQGSDPSQYTVHSAYVDNLNKIATSGIQWFSNLVEQKKNVKPLLEQMGNNEVQARSLRSSRPLCDWIGFLLLCDGPKNVKPVKRERVMLLPADIEDLEPIVPWMVGGSEEEGVVESDVGGPKAKRQLPANAGPVPVPSTPKLIASSSGSKASSKILSSSGKSKVQVKAEATKAEVIDNSLDREKAEEEKVEKVEKVVVAKQEEVNSPPPAKVNPEGRSFGAYGPKKQNDDISSNKKKHKRKHRKQMRD